MESSKTHSLLLICMLFLSTATPIFGCGSCGNPPPKKIKPGSGSKPPKGPINVPPVTLPPIVKPPIDLPPIVKPPISLPPIVKPPISLPPIVKPPISLPPIVKPPISLPPIVKPPISLPPIVKPPVDLPPLPPVSVPPVTVPPVITKPSPAGKPCPPSRKETCPIDTLKLGGCVDLLGGLVHIGVGDPAANECCPVLAGLAEVEAAVCLCTTLKIKALSLNLYVPIALQLLITCGKTPPPGYTCTF